MKFAVVAVVALALAMGVQSHVIPLGVEVAGHGLSYTAVSKPVVAVAPVAHWGHLGHGPVLAVSSPAHVVSHVVAPVHAHAPVVVAHAHAPAHVVAHHVPAPVHVPAVVAVAPAHEGSYVAKTRGAVHSAPLAGHAQSVAAVNVEPAPGTV